MAKTPKRPKPSRKKWKAPRKPAQLTKTERLVLEAKDELKRLILTGELKPPAQRTPRPERFAPAHSGSHVLPMSKMASYDVRPPAHAGIVLPDWFMRELKKLIEKMAQSSGGGPARDVLDPHIEHVNFTSASPGKPLIIEGFNFGPGGNDKGVVLMEVRSGQIEQLEIKTWSDTEIRCQLDELVQDLLPTKQCSLWVVRKDGARSWPWPIDFDPTWVGYRTVSYYFVGGGIFDIPSYLETGTFAKGVMLPEPFRIYACSLYHDGPGSSELRAPSAGMGSFEQGFHAEVPYLQGAYLKFIYDMRAPAGIDPPDMTSQGFSPWFKHPWP
jgi:hypothetical protein